MATNKTATAPVSNDPTSNRFDFSNIKVESGIEVLDRFSQGRDTGLSAVLRKMEVGQSFVIPTEKRGSAVSAAVANNIKIVTRKLKEDPTQLRVWKAGYKQGDGESRATNGAQAAATSKRGKTPMQVPKLSVAKR